ncbi:MAG TPA: hypothetical protein VLS88_03455 [Polyangiales bacterium]|nr:hypothetical protein [Polyangiales bacterium]
MRFSVRRGDRRNVVVGFASLMAIMTAHSVMETARDTLFLSSLPATELPRAYLMIALLAIAELTVHQRVLARVRDRRSLLAASLVFGSLVTLGCWALLEEVGPWAPFGFYVWTGLLITVVLVEFWLLLGDTLTVTQAKRVFPAVAAGGVTGAVLGSLLSEGLLRLMPPAGLIPVAAAILALAAATAFLWKVEDDELLDLDQSRMERHPSLAWLLQDDYLSRLWALVLLGTIAVTVVDFVFKSTVAQNVPVTHLGPFFARFYLGLNAVALVVQLVGAAWLLRSFGAHQSSGLLPLLVFGCAAGLVLGPVLPFAVALKAVDGSLRHTLYRSAVEILFLPLESRRRERAKGMIEVFGHRVGQALASLLIIGAIALGISARQLGLVLLLSSCGWLAAIASTRWRYVDQFRSRLHTKASIRSQATEPDIVLDLDDTALEHQLRSSLLRVVQLLQWRAAIEGNGAVETTDVELLRAALRDKERAALEQTFSLMALQQPGENFSLVWRGLCSDDPRLQAASAEVLEASLTGPVRDAILAIVDDGDPAARRARIASAALGAATRAISYQEARDAMLREGHSLPS